MSDLEIRRVEEVVHETGAGGDRTDVTYQLGGTIDGVFVPFVTKSGGYIEHLTEVGRARQANEPADAGTTPDAGGADGGV